MLWRGRRQSGNVDDQRGSGRGGGFGGLPIKGGLGLVIVVVVISLITGKNPLSLLQSLPLEERTSISQSTPYESTPDVERVDRLLARRVVPLPLLECRRNARLLRAAV